MSALVKTQDGSTVEVQVADALLPPGYKGQQVNASALWAKAMGYWWCIDAKSTIQAQNLIQKLPNLRGIQTIASARYPLEQDTYPMTDTERDKNGI